MWRILAVGQLAILCACASPGPPLSAVPPPDLNVRLLRAVRAHDVAGVHELLQRGADADGVVAGHGPALGIAAEIGDVGAARALLEAGANPNGREGGTPEGETPLVKAAKRGCREVVDLLLAAGADASLRTGAGACCTPLYWAVVYDHAPIVVSLVASVADVNARSVSPRVGEASGSVVRRLADPTQGETPLMVAARSGHVGCVFALLQAGANPNLRDEQGRTALELTRLYRSPVPDIVRLLKDGGADPQVHLR